MSNYTIYTLVNSINVNIPEWPILFLFIFSIVGFIGNLLVCLAIKIDPKLQNATNYYLFSLATTDLLVSIIVIPFSILKSFYNKWIFGNVACTLFVFLDVFLCTTSILLLCIISCERYIGIKNPLKNRDKSKTKTKLVILLTWSLSFLLSSPIILLAYIDSNNIIQDLNCNLYNKHFIVYGSIISFIIPLFIMMIMYILTVHRLRKVLTDFKKKQLNNVSSCCYLSDNRLGKFRYNIKYKIENEHKVFYSSSNSNSNSSNLIKFETICNKNRFINRTMNTFQNRKESIVVKNEQKAVKVLGIVFVIFVIAWAPFAVLNILSALFKKFSVYPSLLNILTWFGYISSSINPIIYNAFNQKYRIAFKKILSCDLNSIRKQQSFSGIQQTTNSKSFKYLNNNHNHSFK